MRITLAGAVSAALLCLPAAAAQGAAKGGNPYELKPDDAVPSLRMVALGQIDRDLVLTVRARSALRAADFGAGGASICLIATQSARKSRLCIDHDGPAWRLLRGTKVADGARFGQPLASKLQVRITPADAGLEIGALRWSVELTAGDPCTAPDVCISRAPRTADATFPGRVWRVVSSGCVVRGPAQVSRGPNVKRVALTYDDGPAAITSRFVDELEQLGVTATFFQLGQAVPARAPLLRRMIDAGFELANHSWNHANLGRGGPAASDQIARTNAAIRRATGFTPCLFRPPYGSTGADLVARARALEMTSVLWSADPNDWRRPGTDAIVARTLAEAGNGGILLSHDGGGPREQTLAAIGPIVTALKRRGYTFVTVSELLGYRQKLALVR